MRSADVMKEATPEGFPQLSLRPSPYWVRILAGLVRWLPAGRYRLTHWLGGRAIPPFLARVPNGFSFVCDLRDSIAREVCFTGQYEPQETALVRQLLAPGMTFVDVGANWGYFTLLAACRVGPAGRVIGFEPDPRLHDLLTANLLHNRLAVVKALRVAASDRHGTLALALFDEQEGNWGLSRLTGDPSAATLAVPMAPIDEVLDECGVGEVDLVKMDIEGAEDLALRGMRRGLARHRYRRVLLEGHPALLAERGRTFEEAVAPLREAGYRQWRINHSAAASRRAAYGRVCRPVELLHPMAPGEPQDAWPHVLWISPSVVGLEQGGFGDRP